MSDLNNNQLRALFDRKEVTAALREAVGRLKDGEYIHVWKTGHFGKPAPGIALDRTMSELDIDQIEQWNVVEGKNIYIALNPMRGDVRAKEHTSRLIANWIDVDCGIGSVDAALSFALAQPVRPTRAVMSGDGIHLHYYNGSIDYDEWLSKQEGLYTTFKAHIRSTDRQVVTDQARLLKLRGTIASKDGKYQHRRVESLYVGSDVDGDGMRKAFPWSPAPVPSTTSGDLVAKSKPRVHEEAEEHIENGCTIVERHGCEEDHECSFKKGREAAIYSLATSLKMSGTPNSAIQVMCERFNDECCDPPITEKDGDSFQRQIDRGIEQGEENRRNRIEETDSNWLSKRETTKAVAVIDTMKFLGSVDDIREFKQMDIEELSFSAPRGSLGATFGVLDIGKSKFQRNLAISQACGRPYFPGTIFVGGDGYRVLYVNTEGGIGGLMKQLNLMFNDLDEEHYSRVQQNFKYIHMRDPRFWINGQPLDVTKDAHAKFFVRLISDWGIDAWHIDTFPAMSPFRSEIDPGEWLRKTSVLENIAAETDSVGYYTLHAGKGNGIESEGRSGMDVHKARGSTGNIQLAQCAYFLDGDPNGEKPIRLKVAKAKEEKPALRQIKHTSRGWLVDASEQDIAVSNEEKILARAIQSDSAPVRARILSYLKYHPEAPPTRVELAEAVGSKLDTVTRTVGRMLGQTLREDSTGRIHRIAEAS